MELTSEAFSDGGMIPKRFTCEGENISPPLKITDIPEKAKTLAILVTDPDIPKQVQDNMGIDVFDHWVVFNIPADAFDDNGRMDEGAGQGTPGVNSSADQGYTGPCPPAEYEPTEHRYVFRVYALDNALDCPLGAKKEVVQESMSGHVLAKTKLVGRYEKQHVA